MDWIAILLALLILGAIGLLFGVLLGIAAKKFEVEQDERVDKIKACLGGANCGGCGFAGCDAFTNAVIAGEAPVDGCPAGGSAAAKAIAQIMGVDAAPEKERMVARVLCQGHNGVAKDRYSYDGYESCRAVSSFAGGTKLCHYSCVGLGDCVKKCAFGGITIENGIANIDANSCKACGECINACPRSVIKLVPANATINVLCRNMNFGRAAKDACMKACIGCKRCEKECSEGAISVVNNVASIDYDKCTHCGACAAVCPCGAIVDILKQQ